MEVYKVTLNLKQVLDQHGFSAYALWRASGLPRNTVYSLTQGKAQRLDLNTLASVIYGLEELTGKHFTPNDLLEVQRDAP